MAEELKKDAPNGGIFTCEESGWNGKSVDDCKFIFDQA